MQPEPGASSARPDRSRLARAATRTGRALLVIVGVLLWGWGMAGLIGSHTQVGHAIAGVAGVALVVLALAGPARVVQLVVQGLAEGGAGSK